MSINFKILCKVDYKNWCVDLGYCKKDCVYKG